MPIQVSTVYTEERLLRLNRYIVGSKKILWVIMTVCTLVVLGCFGLSLWLDILSPQLTFCFGLIVVMDAVYLYCCLILPRFAVRKSKNLNTTVHFAFEGDHLCLEAANAYATESSTIQYAMLTKVVKGKEDLYLFLNRYQAYIVDLSQLSAEQIRELKQILETSIQPRKFRWTD